MKLKILIENTVFQTGVSSEHGFSLYLENNGKKVIFDTGQTEAFLHNASTFGIQLEEIDALVISHGHYDHTGGIAAFLQKNKHAKIYAKHKFNEYKTKQGDVYIGIPEETKIPADRIYYVENPTEIIPDIFAMPDITIKDTDDTHFNRFKIKENGEEKEDYFEDELYLALLNNEKLSIVSGCAHRGIINTIHSALIHFPLPLELVIGGFHTQNESNEKVAKLIEKLNRLNIQRICPCHCTGIEKYTQIKNNCNSKVEYGYTGLTIFL